MASVALLAIVTVWRRPGVVTVGSGVVDWLIGSLSLVLLVSVMVLEGSAPFRGSHDAGEEGACNTYRTVSKVVARRTLRE
jgi:hypothetical protein